MMNSDVMVHWLARGGSLASCLVVGFFGCVVLCLVRGRIECPITTMCGHSGTKAKLCGASDRCNNRAWAPLCGLVGYVSPCGAGGYVSRGYVFGWMTMATVNGGI